MPLKSLIGYQLLVGPSPCQYDIKLMAQPLILKTVIVPREQNCHGQDIIRFTADYLASDIAAHCIGFYPRARAELETDAKSSKIGQGNLRPWEIGNLKAFPTGWPPAADNLPHTHIFTEAGTLDLECGCDFCVWKIAVSNET